MPMTRTIKTHLKMLVTSRLTFALVGFTFAVAMTVLFEPIVIAQSRIATTMDLVRLRDVGSVSVSPSGRYVVYQVYQANPTTNTYSNQWILVDTTTGKSRMIVSGGNPILTYEDNQAYVTDYGDDLAYLAPVWFSDDAFYYVRKDDGLFSLHRATLDGGDTPIQGTVGTITDFRRIDADHALIVTSAPSAATQAQAQRDLRDGFLYFGPTNIQAWRGIPQRTPVDVPHYYALNLRTRAIRPVTSTYAGATDTLAVFRTTHNALATLDIMYSPDRKSIAFFALMKSHHRTDRALYVSSPDGKNAIAVVPPTSMLPRADFVWSPDSRRIYYVRQAKQETPSTTDLYVLDIASRYSERLTNEHGFIDRCTLSTNIHAAACTVEWNLRPADVLFVDLVTHRTRLLSDLNPMFDQLVSRTRVRFLVWQDGWGNKVWGKLTYPSNYVRGRRYPLVILTYDAIGFQRGGSGDEYPILPLSSKGFFVLNTTLNSLTYDPEKHSPARLQWLLPQLDAMNRIISQLSRDGLIDQHEVGIGGLSYGSVMSLYAVSHSPLFRAAIASGTSALDPIFYYLKDKGWDQAFKNWGLDGSPYGANLAKWEELSPALQAAQTYGAVLINAPDVEYIPDLQQYWELRDRRRPAELWVYSDEEHTKHQPAHRLAIYNHNIDWYRFWLQDYEDPDPAKTAQYRRWEALRKLQEQGPHSRH